MKEKFPTHDPNASREGAVPSIEQIADEVMRIARASNAKPPQVIDVVMKAIGLNRNSHETERTMVLKELARRGAKKRKKRTQRTVEDAAPVGPTSLQEHLQRKHAWKEEGVRRMKEREEKEEERS